MMSPSRFQIARKDIISLFENNGTRAYTYNEISKILAQNRGYWRLPADMYNEDFIELLVKTTRMKRYSFDFPARRINRFTWGDVSIYQLALSLEKDSYLSHYTALYLHDLTDQIPKKIYVTDEQPWKNFRRTQLMQKDIDNAFLKPPRVSNNIARFEDYNICLLNGQFTNRLGVVSVDKLIVTSVERTLIDAAVRPIYSGGIYEVLNAYRKAVGRVSINRLCAILRKLNYIYPYHQAIGFYLQRAGVYRESQMRLLKNFDFEYDFYITYQMKGTEYSKEWRLYYPKGF